MWIIRNSFLFFTIANCFYSETFVICVIQTRFKGHQPANLQRFIARERITWRPEDMEKRKRFVHYWTFVWGNHRWLAHYSHKYPARWSCYVFFILALDKLLNWDLRRHDEYWYLNSPRNTGKVDIISRAVRPIEGICKWVYSITNPCGNFIPKNDTNFSISSWRLRQNDRRFADDI